MMEMESDVFRFDNRVVKFYRDDRVPDPDENRRLEVPITEEEHEELSKKYRLWTIGETFPKLIVRILSDVKYSPSTSPVDLVVRMRGWSFNDNAGTVAYLQSCVPTEQEQ